MAVHQHPHKGLAVGTAKHHWNKYGDLYHLRPGCPTEEPGRRGWFCQVLSMLASRSCPPGDIRGTALPCLPQARCIVAPHASQDLHGPVGTTTFGGFEGPPGPTAPLRKQIKTSSFLVLLSGAGTSCHQVGEDHGTAAGPGLLLRLLVGVFSTTTTSLQPGPTCWAWTRMALV